MFNSFKIIVLIAFNVYAILPSNYNPCSLYILPHLLRDFPL